MLQAWIKNKFLFVNVQTLRSSNHTIAHSKMNNHLWSRLYSKLFNDALTAFSGADKTAYLPSMLKALKAAMMPKTDYPYIRNYSIPRYA